MYLPVVHHWVSLHWEKLFHWSKARQLDGSLWQDYKTHTSFFQTSNADYVWTIEPCTFPLSGTFAMHLAYLMGAQRIILAGIPADGTRRFFDPEPRKDYAYGSGDSYGDKRDREQFLREMRRVPAMKQKIRSMSGWTRVFFGHPYDPDD
jgi:hypothetical protein